MPEEPAHLVGLRKVCPRCQCSNLKFLFYNNRSVSQPRYKCLGCSKDFTLGGRIRERNAQQEQQQLIGRIGVQRTIGGVGGEVGRSDRTRNGEEISGTDRNAVGGEVRRSDRLSNKPTGIHVLPESLAQNPVAAAIPPDDEIGSTQVEVRENSAAALPVAKPLAIPRYGDEIMVEGASNIWVKAVLGSAPYDLAQLRERSPKDTRNINKEDRHIESRSANRRVVRPSGRVGTVLCAVVAEAPMRFGQRCNSATVQQNCTCWTSCTVSAAILLPTG